MIVKLLTEHHLEFLRLKGGCRGSSESTHVKMPHCWNSHALAHIVLDHHILLLLAIGSTICLTLCQWYICVRTADESWVMAWLVYMICLHFLYQWLQLQSFLSSDSV